jgi:hypothetical protein
MGELGREVARAKSGKCRRNMRVTRAVGSAVEDEAGSNYGRNWRQFRNVGELSRIASYPRKEYSSQSPL